MRSPGYLWLFVFQINGTELKDSNVADCINIIKAATERVTLKILKPKPTQAVDQADSKPKPTKPSRPAEAAEPDIVPKSNVDLTNFRLMVPFYTPWKHQKTIWFSGVFRGYKMETVARNGIVLELFDFKSALFRGCHMTNSSYAHVTNFPVHLFSTPWKHKTVNFLMVGKGCISNKLVKPF